MPFFRRKKQKHKQVKTVFHREIVEGCFLYIFINGHLTKKSLNKQMMIDRNEKVDIIKV